LQRYERCRILVEGDSSLAQEIAAEIEKEHRVEIIDEPHEELVMIKVRESVRNSLFYLGEALMCSCRVKLGDTIGHGMVIGTKRNLAYNLALIDAAFSSGIAAKKEADWEARIREEARKLARREAREATLIDKTRVDFSTMKVEV
jgi:alpha-D-ribose 1-methylphosphonate 5-triphosphate synthase subunit PhnG